MSVIETTLEIPVQYSTAVFGPFDEYVKKIEKTLKVTIVSRDSQLMRGKCKKKYFQARRSWIIQAKQEAVCHNILFGKNTGGLWVCRILWYSIMSARPTGWAMCASTR